MDHYCYLLLVDVGTEHVLVASVFAVAAVAVVSLVSLVMTAAVHWCYKLDELEETELVVVVLVDDWDYHLMVIETTAFVPMT